MAKFDRLRDALAILGILQLCEVVAGLLSRWIELPALPFFAIYAALVIAFGVASARSRS